MAIADEFVVVLPTMACQSPPNAETQMPLVFENGKMENGKEKYWPC